MKVVRTELDFSKYLDMAEGLDSVVGEIQENYTKFVVSESQLAKWREGMSYFGVEPTGEWYDVRNELDGRIVRMNEKMQEFAKLVGFDYGCTDGVMFRIVKGSVDIGFVMNGSNAYFSGIVREGNDMTIIEFGHRKYTSIGMALVILYNIAKSIMNNVSV